MLTTETVFGLRRAFISLVSFLMLIGQVQHKLNRVATSSGSANPSIAMSALLQVMADALTQSAGRGDAGKVRHHFEGNFSHVVFQRRARLTSTNGSY